MRLAVTGSEGQLVRSLIEVAPEGVDIVPIGRPALDLADPGTIETALAAVGADAIVAAAAYTKVDQAESEPELAHRVNAEGAGSVATAAARFGVPIIHLSTDYVFDGLKAGPYQESDPVAPATAYGRSKLAGEQLVAEAAPNHAILRTAWVYSPFGHNFVKTMLRLASDREEIAVVGDQYGNPTSALDLAQGVIAVADNLISDTRTDFRGVFHISGAGATTWADFAETVFEFSKMRGGPSARVRAIATSDYPTPAPRPANSTLNCDRLAAVHGVRLSPWPEALQRVIERLSGDMC